MESPGPKIPKWIELWNWGNVPPDADVRPASSIVLKGAQENRKNKRHHFVSVTYMNGFRDATGRVWSYRSATPETPHHVKPTATGFEGHYYSFLRDDGTKDNASFEDRWGATETVWDETLKAVKLGRVSPAISFNILAMAVLMRTRVPAARERKELLLATHLREGMKALERAGRLPEAYQAYAGRLDTVPVASNPQESLRLMIEDQYVFGQLCFEIGFEILNNRTGIPFLTSDNPVCIYDPRKPLAERIPYELNGEVELIFPIDAHTLLRGSNRLRPVNAIGGQRDLTDADAVQHYNQTIAQFAYRFLLSPDRSADELASRYAATVPTVDINVTYKGKNIEIHYGDVFGPMPTLSPFIDSPEKAARLAPEWQIPPAT